MYVSDRDRRRHEVAARKAHIVIASPKNVLRLFKHRIIGQLFIDLFASFSSSGPRLDFSLFSSDGAKKVRLGICFIYLSNGQFVIC